MNIIVYRYGNICETDIIESFRQSGLSVTEITIEITDKNLSNAARIEAVDKELSGLHPLFLFSINFYPALAKLCKLRKIPYLCWTVDSPVSELFSEFVTYDTNRIFLFDRAQYKRFAPYNPSHIFHLPLASATNRFDEVIRTISAQDKKQFAGDISFVGSLYSEKNPLAKASGLSAYTKGYLDALESASIKIFGYNPVELSLTSEVISDIIRSIPGFYRIGKTVEPCESYICAHNYIGMEISMKERINTLKYLAQFFDVNLYTYSDTSVFDDCLHKPNMCGSVASLTEMPKVFHLSKINLNMTIKPIQEGLPLRIFDIMGCGGFCMTNFQPELPDHFEIGTDLEAYSGLEELADKCAYYLSHEDERKKIAANGYQKVCSGHTYMHRIKTMLEKAFAT